MNTSSNEHSHKQVSPRREPPSAVHIPPPPPFQLVLALYGESCSAMRPAAICAISCWCSWFNTVATWMLSSTCGGVGEGMPCGCEAWRPRGRGRHASEAQPSKAVTAVASSCERMAFESLPRSHSRTQNTPRFPHFPHPHESLLQPRALAARKFRAAPPHRLARPLRPTLRSTRARTSSGGTPRSIAIWRMRSGRLREE